MPVPGEEAALSGHAHARRGQTDEKYRQRRLKAPKSGMILNTAIRNRKATIAGLSTAAAILGLTFIANIDVLPFGVQFVEYLKARDMSKLQGPIYNRPQVANLRYITGLLAPRL